MNLVLIENKWKKLSGSDLGFFGEILMESTESGEKGDLLRQIR